MKHFIAILHSSKIVVIGVILVFLSTTSAFSQKIPATFIGNCAFKFQLDTLTMFSDFPYKSGAYGYMKYNMDSVYQNEKGLTLITHKHNDHFSERTFSKTRLKRIGPKVSSRKISMLKEKYGIALKPVRTKHNFSMNHRSFSLEWKNRKIYFMGDTESYDNLLKEKDFDILFITPWILENMLRDHIKVKANTIFLYHHTSDVTPIRKKASTICDCDFIIPAQSTTYEI